MCDQSCSQRWMRKDRDQSKLIKSINYQLLTRQLQGRIKQREKTVVTICHLGNASLHQFYYSLHVYF